MILFRISHKNTSKETLRELLYNARTAFFFHNADARLRASRHFFNSGSSDQLPPVECSLYMYIELMERVRTVVRMFRVFT